MVPGDKDSEAFSGSGAIYLGALLLIVGATLWSLWMMAIRLNAADPIGPFLQMCKSHSASIGALLGMWSMFAFPKLIRARIAVGFFCATLSLLFLVHLYLILHLNEPLTLSKVFYFVHEWRIAPMRTWLVLAIVGVGAVFVLFGPRLRSTKTRLCSIQCIAAVLVGLEFMPLGDGEISRRYSPFLGIIADIRDAFAPASRYSTTESVSALMAQAFQSKPLNLGGRNLIILAVESFSPVDSKLASGLKDHFPRTDALAAKGMFFRNFMSGYGTTEGALVSIYQGIAPIPYPGSSRFINRSFEDKPSLVRQAVKDGYRTAFLASTPMSFLNKGPYLRAIGFHSAEGRDDIERFIGAPRYSFWSPSDAVLYQEALARIMALSMEKRPFLLGLLTGTGHLPWTDPLGRADTEENVLDFVDQQIDKFVNELEKIDFFSNGILVIMGDHRKMLPMTEDELREFGESAYARVPLIVIGDGIPKGIVDQRLLSQTDLLRSLYQLGTSDRGLSPFAIFVRYIGFKVDFLENNVPADFLAIEAENPQKAYAGRISGKKIEWRETPPKAEAISQAIHRQRALHQLTRTTSFACSMRFSSHTRYRDSKGDELEIAASNSDEVLARVASFRQLDLTRFADGEGKVDLELRTFVPIEESGVYRFDLQFRGEVCLGADGISVQLVSDATSDKLIGITRLPRGDVDIRIRVRGDSLQKIVLGLTPLNVMQKGTAKL